MGSHSIRRFIPLILILVAVIAAIVYLYDVSQADDAGPLQASGTVETIEVVAAPEMGGRVVEVFVNQGDTVQVGDPLFRLEDELLQAQRLRAVAGLETAQANLEVAKMAQETAQASVAVAHIHYQNALNTARRQEQPSRTTSWEKDVPDEFDLPTWYYTESEQMKAAEAEVQFAQEALEAEQDNFEAVVHEADNAGIVQAETRLAEAQAAFLIAQDVFERAENANDPQIEAIAQSSLDIAEAELEAAQLAYEQILAEGTAEDVLEARARLAIVQERYDTALDRQALLLSGENSLEVQAARANVHQAEAQLEQVEAKVTQAEKALAQTQAELNLVDVQLAKLTVRAAVSGVVITRNTEPGEIIAAGMPAMTIGQLDKLSITVYIPEDRYGEISLGERAEVTVDSFPNRSFSAIVARIADQAEYTPRNVQTEEGRRTTVFAIELSVDDPQGRLKPGMPADVQFTE